MKPNSYFIWCNDECWINKLVMERHLLCCVCHWFPCAFYIRFCFSFNFMNVSSQIIKWDRLSECVPGKGGAHAWDLCVVWFYQRLGQADTSCIFFTFCLFRYFRIKLEQPNWKNYLFTTLRFSLSSIYMKPFHCYQFRFYLIWFENGLLHLYTKWNK